MTTRAAAVLHDSRAAEPAAISLARVHQPLPPAAPPLDASTSRMISSMAALSQKEARASTPVRHGARSASMWRATPRVVTRGSLRPHRGAPFKFSRCTWYKTSTGSRKLYASCGAHLFATTWWSAHGGAPGSGGRPRCSFQLCRYLL